jgi:cysteine synthase
MLNQFANEDNWKHIIKLQVRDFDTHRNPFVAAMGTTGTIITSTERENPAIQIMGPTSEWFANSGYP